MREGIKDIVFITIIIIISLLLMSFTIYAKNIETQQSKYDLIVDLKGFGDYRSIQDAINNAELGSTIYIKTGEYSEIIDIKKLIYLIGENKDTTIINPISEENKYAIRLGAPGSYLSSLTIINGASGLYSTGIKISASNTEIYNCNFYDTPVGLAVWTSGNNIENCFCKGCKDEGIALLGSKNSECIENQIKNCLFYDNCDGIELQYSSKNKIENCKFYNNTHSGIDAIAKLNDNNIILNCEIYNNKVHGIYLSASSNNQIINCNMANNKDGNIVMNKYSFDNQVINNEKDEKDSFLKLNFKSLINRLYEKVERLKESRIYSFFNNLNF
ncbi:MAG: right-handed parallel beta-helix repeat-containing protein [Thermoplasmatales archaeon]|nr:MAG: right-handed parallel beta-helix repeat-containing protein [Thermoplasmatales archaeon]